MSDAGLPIVYFDLVGTLGEEFATLEQKRLARFRSFPRAHRLLTALHDRARLGVLSMDPELDPKSIEAAIRKDGALAPLIDPALIQVFPSGSAAGLVDAVYVAIDERLRWRAIEAGMRAVPDALLVAPLLDGEPLHFLRATLREGGRYVWRELIEGLRVVPVHTSLEPGPVLHASASRSAAETLARRARVELIGTPEDVARTTLYLIQARRPLLEQSSAGRAFLERTEEILPLVTDTGEGFIVAVPGDQSIDDLHPPGAAHGHTVALIPDPFSLDPPPAHAGISARVLSEAERETLSTLDSGRLRPFVDRLAGFVPLEGGSSDGVRLSSRHSDHAHNTAATAWLLGQMGTILGNGNARTCNTGSAASDESPRFNVLGQIPGTTLAHEYVVVGAHLDSTAEYGTYAPGQYYQPAVDPAPGADDDASGAGGVLAVAQTLRDMALSGSPERTILFALFNKEEQGRMGSKAYAQAMRQHDVPVVAMLQMDMIGWRDPAQVESVFEVHGTGFTDPADVKMGSTNLVNTVVDAASQVATELQPERYPLVGPNGVCPRDPADLRSDHASFHTARYAACLVCEDLFNESCATPAQTGNPNYHKNDDQGVNHPFAALVARSVAAAAWMIATPGGGPQSGPTFASSTVASSATPVPEASGIAPGPRAVESEGAPAETIEPRSITVDSSGGTGMPNKYLVEFMARWIRDRDFRCDVLHQELTTLQNEGFSAKQIEVLTSLDRQTILDEMCHELEDDLGIDLNGVRWAVHGLLPTGSDLSPGDEPPLDGGPGGNPILFPGGGGRGGGRGRMGTRVGLEYQMMAVTAALSSTMLYGEGNVHLRNTDPESIGGDTERMITVRGQGFEPNTKPEVRFTTTDASGNTLEKSGNVKSVSCDIDIYQRVEVKVWLDHAGEWLIRARNPGGNWSVPLPIQVT